MSKRKNQKLSQSEEDQIVKKSIKNNVLEEKAISCSIYKEGNNRRDLVIVPVPKRYINNKSKKWLPNSIFNTLGDCINCGFYLSTGTSNIGKNFPGMWFPFLRIQEKDKKYSSDMEKGWIYKASGLHREHPKFWEKLIEFGIKKTEFLEKVFFEKFSHWWQVQISAALPLTQDSLWNSHEELIKLKTIALMFDYTFTEGWKRNSNIVTKWYVPECNYTLSKPEEINNWLLQNKALCETKDI
jgi:hypothetical protein